MRAFLVAILALGAQTARADDCLDIAPRPFAGTIAYRAGVLTRTSFGTAFGVASFLEGRILPDLERGLSVVSFSSGAVAGSTRLATIRPGCAILGDPYQTLPTMQYAVNIGLGAKLPYGFELFYAGNVTESLILGDSVGENFAGHLTLLKGLGTGFIAPLMMALTDNTVDGPQASYYDFVIGAGWGIGYGSIRAGYVGSQGLFLDVGAYKIGLNASVVFDFDDALISYLKGGIGPYSSPIGLTSAFARGSILSSGPHVDPSTGREIAGPVAQDEWVTVHLEHELVGTAGWGVGRQNSAGPVLATVEVALTVRPNVEFYTARATFHGEYMFLSAGLTQAPDLFAIGGNHDLRFSAGAGMELSVPNPDEVRPEQLLPLVSMRIALNSPEMVRLFPMSVGQLVTFHLEFHLDLIDYKAAKAAKDRPTATDAPPPPEVSL